MSTGSVMAKADAKNISNGIENRVDIGDISLNAKVMGDGKASVVFDSGYGDGLYTYSNAPDVVETWGGVQPEIAKYATTIAYDRAGLGSSDTGTNRPPLSEAEIQTVMNGGEIPYNASNFETGTGKTALDKARNLHALLKKEKMKAPYILVVHSISMETAIEFAKEYHNEVAGIVSVDGSWPTVFSDVVGWAKVYAPDMVDLFIEQFTPADGTVSEDIESSYQVRNAGDVLRKIPFTILHAMNEGNGDAYQKMTDDKIKEYLKWSDCSKEILVPNSGHYIMNDQPQYVIDAVKDMINRVESKNK